MKLELKHLAPYLPYGLKVYNSIFNSTKFMTVSFDSQVSISLESVIEHETLKPILRPMSEAIVPYDKIKLDQDGYKEPNDLFIDGNGNVAIDFQAGGATISWPIKSMQYYMEDLFKNHFDVFGLIDTGLAIDINTLSPNVAGNP